MRVWVNLVVLGIVSLVAAGVWLTMDAGMDAGPDDTAARDVVEATQTVIDTEVVRHEPFDDSTLAVGVASSTPATGGYGELVFAVQNAAAFPLPAVRIILRSVNDRQDTNVSKTDAAGEAVFGPLPSGAYRYSLEAPYRPSLVGAKAITLAAEERRVVEIQLDDYAQPIQGRVIDADASPVVGIEITAQRSHAGNEVQLITNELKVVTDGVGTFALHALAPGEYTVQTGETERYASVKKIVRAGSMSTVLRVAARRLLQVTGEVKDNIGLPLAGVLVYPLRQSPAAARTDNLGHYTLTLKVDSAQRRLHLRFSASGYRDELISINEADWTDADAVVHDVTLEGVSQTGSVSGRLTDDYAMPVAGERVHLFSRRENAHYQTQSDASGSFTFPAVVTGDDYRFWVRPKGNYSDYTREKISINSVAVELDAKLVALPTGSVYGRVIDHQGNPVSRVRLLLYSAQATGRPIDVVTDSAGSFEIPAVPIGVLHVKTRSSPRLHMENIELQNSEDKYVEIVLDGKVAAAAEVPDT